MAKGVPNEHSRFFAKKIFFIFLEIRAYWVFESGPYLKRRDYLKRLAVTQRSLESGDRI
jgi:hypothetical protein